MVTYIGPGSTKVSLSRGTPLLAWLEMSVYMQAIYQLPRRVFRYAVGAAPQCDHGQKEDKALNQPFGN